MKGMNTVNMKITCHDHTFFIEGLTSRQLFLKTEEKMLEVKKTENTFTLSIEELLEFFKVKNHPLKFIDENGQMIQFASITEPVEFAENSYLKKGKHKYFIYIDQEDELCLIYNKKPSIMHFYNRDVDFHGMVAQDDKVILKFSFHSKYFQVDQPKCFIKIRNQEYIDLLAIERFSVTPVDARYYKTEVEASLNKEQIRQILGDGFSYETFNPSIYDLSFGFTIKEMTISAFTPRIKYFKTNPELLNDEHWVPFNESHHFLVRPYSTLHEALSLRIIPIPTETYEYYTQPERPLVQTDPAKKTIVCFEYPDKAQDNGMIFFKFLVDRYKKRFNVFYIVTETSTDLKNLVGYEQHVIFYKSPENIEVVRKADILCHTHSSHYVLPFATYKMEELAYAKQKIFLQHGIIGSKDVSAVYGKKEPNPFTDLFVVSSEREKQLIARDYGFEENEIIVTGLARFDHLINERTRFVKRYLNRKKILFMPTWRPKVENYKDEQFIETDYYQEFQSLITDPVLQAMHEQGGYEISFYLHRNFQKFNHLFKSDFVKVLRQEDQTVKDLLEINHVLVTDYSSVGLDFSLMHKKVIYYRPETLLGDDNAGESADLLPGDVIETREALLASLREPNMPVKFKSKLQHIYPYKDKKASRRIFKAMEEHFSL